MAQEKPLHTVSRWGLTLSIFSNRVEAKDGGCLFSKRTMIPFKQIAAVQFDPAIERLTIETTGGKRHNFLLSGMGNRAREAAAVIQNHL
jgi:hypothetical protein